MKSAISGQIMDLYFLTIFTHFYPFLTNFFWFFIKNCRFDRFGRPIARYDYTQINRPLIFSTKKLKISHNSQQILRYLYFCARHSQPKCIISRNIRVQHLRFFAFFRKSDFCNFPEENENSIFWKFSFSPPEQGFCPCIRWMLKG